LLYPNLAAIAENIHTPPIPHPIAAYSPADKSEIVKTKCLCRIIT
jgi:hypothetical protein